MGVVSGLAAITGRLDAEEAKFSGKDRGPKTTWFKLSDKQSVKIIFLQELDGDAEGFSEKNGLGAVAVEHQHPDNYVVKALCTAEDGECYACEQHSLDYKAGWKPRLKLYINVLVDNGVDEPFVALLSQGTSAKAITPALIEVAQEFGSISDAWFKIKRTGSGFNDTSYTLTRLKEHDLKVEDFELFELENVLRDIPYSEQEAFYARGAGEDTKTDDAPAKDTTATDADVW